MTPIKTLDLPLGGSKGIRTALQIIIDFISISNILQTNKNISIDFGTDDDNGLQTLNVLKKTEKLTNKITGNDKGSLGLHPAIYYYGPSGVHSSPLFLGTVKYISERIINNDSKFFYNFSIAREIIENALITHKELIATCLQKLGSLRRVDVYSKIFGKIYEKAKTGQTITEENITEWAGLSGKIVVGNEKTTATEFSRESKSKIFIQTALFHAMKCPLCRGYIDSNKSISYDHIIRKEDKGLGNWENGQITHPYCNQSLKN